MPDFEQRLRFIVEAFGIDRVKRQRRGGQTSLRSVI